MDSPDGVRPDEDLTLRRELSLAGTASMADLAMRVRGQAPQPRSGAPKAPGLRSASHRQITSLPFVA